jgi:hypothetical protein
MGSRSRKDDVGDERYLAELAVLEILARNDLEYLIKHGAPPDEYFYESRMIINALVEASSVEAGVLPSLDAIAEIVEIEFIRSFGSSYGHHNGKRYDEVNLAFTAYEISKISWNWKRISYLTWRLK